MHLNELEPDTYKAMYVLEHYGKKIPVSPIIKAIIKIRVSQINKYAFSQGMSTKAARAIGESKQRIYALCAWQDSSLFSIKINSWIAF